MTHILLKIQKKLSENVIISTSAMNSPQTSLLGQMAKRFRFGVFEFDLAGE